MGKLVAAALIGLMVGFASLSFGGPDIGQPAPDFSEPDTGGVSHSLSDFSGQVVVLNFWASW